MMKKITLTICLILIVSGCMEGKKGHYIVLGGGHGGATDSTNLAMEGVKIVQSEGRDSLTALGFTIIFNSGDIPSDTESTSGSWAEWYKYEVESGYITDAGVRRDWPEMGLFGKYGLEVAEDTGLFVNVLGGITFADEVHLYYSALGPPHYTENEGWTTRGMFGGGISYFFDDELYLQADYDNRRGLTVGIGWKN